jgi:SAM-dependent methyltransferase
MSSLDLARGSVAALTALKEIGDGQPSPSQTEALAGWSGWGPLAKALNWCDREKAWDEIATQLQKLLSYEEMQTARDAVDTAYYTPAAVSGAVWDVVAGLGFTGGRVLEPGCGSGRFIAAAPAGMHLDWTGVEADRVTARIAALLHPDARIVHGRLEKTPLRFGGFDLAIGNVPFSSEGPYDPAAPKGLSLHNYFIWRALSAVRPGGLVALVTSRWTMDAADQGQRLELAQLGRFIGAFRLPGKALAAGGTQAVTDVVVFRRHTAGDESGARGLWLRAATQPDNLLTTVNEYFQRNPALVVGEMSDKAGLRHGMTLDVRLPDGEDLETALAKVSGMVVRNAIKRGLTWLPPVSGLVHAAPGRADHQAGERPAGAGARRARAGRADPVAGRRRRAVLRRGGPGHGQQRAGADQAAGPPPVRGVRPPVRAAEPVHAVGEARP